MMATVVQQHGAGGMVCVIQSRVATHSGRGRCMGIRIVRTELPEVLVVETDYVRDERGFFIESYHHQRYVDHGIGCAFVQDNHSRSGKGVLRGLHYQDQRAPMDKLVRCTAGRILDVAVDLRRSSPHYGRWAAVELSADNMWQLFVPVGFAHGFLALTDGVEVQYKCSGYYTPSAEGSVRWDDPDLAIDWPIQAPILSARDRVAPSLAEYGRRPAFE
jgi:dTDP-4-dehydrorhamnose 3,5-epimerase